MKKIVSFLLVIAIALLALTGCYKDDYALLIGVYTSQNGQEVTNTVAAVVIDKDYKIVSCRIDSIAVKAELTDEGKINGEKTYQSKVELGDTYGMLTNSPYYGSSLAEWDDQVKAFESYVVGKTHAEINGISLNENGSSADEALRAGCTIAVTDFIKALDKAFKNGHMVGFQTKKSFTLGVAVSADVAGKDDSTASFTADFGAIVIADGEVLAATLDSNEATCTVKDGNFSKVSYKGTKLEQGDSYGMVAYGNAIGEWYEQAQAFADSAVGKNVSDLAGLATEGVAGCTMYVGGYKKTLEKAASYAR